MSSLRVAVFFFGFVALGAPACGAVRNNVVGGRIESLETRVEFAVRHPVSNAQFQDLVATREDIVQVVMETREGILDPGYTARLDTIHTKLAKITH